MGLLRSDIRYTIDTMIAIAKTTTSPTMRESLLEEAMDILRNGTDSNDTCGINCFMSMFVPSRQTIKVTDLYKAYCSYCLGNGHRVASRKVVKEGFRDKGFRLSTLNGYSVFYACLKEVEPQSDVDYNPCAYCEHLFDKVGCHECKVKPKDIF